MDWLRQKVSDITGIQEPIYGPSAIQTVGQQAEKGKPYTVLSKDDLCWKAPNSTCVETQTFYIFADSGHVGLLQLIYSNIG